MSRRAALRHWDEQRKRYAQTIQGILGEPGSSARGVRALPTDLKEGRIAGSVERLAKQVQSPILTPATR